MMLLEFEGDEPASALPAGLAGGFRPEVPALGLTGEEALGRRAFRGLTGLIKPVTAETGCS